MGQSRLGPPDRPGGRPWDDEGWSGEASHPNRHPAATRGEQGALMADPRTTLASLSGVRKRFGATVALDGLDLQVRAGELLSVLGPNGAGQTTAIGILLGLQQADA